MNRRSFLSTSAGLSASLLLPGFWSCQRTMIQKKKIEFTIYNKTETLIPVLKVTPDDGFYVHTYYDVCPFSPSGRYLVVSRLPYEDQPPQYGDAADVCIIDIEDQTIETIYTTKCWGHQTGTLAQWGATDQFVYTNDVIDNKAVCVEIDLESEQVKAFQGPMYHISPDGSSVAGFPLELLEITQRGYGLAAIDYDNPPALPVGASKNEGIWKTDLKTGKKTLIVSLAEIADNIPEPPPRPDGTYYFWHSKYNLQGDRLMQVQRCLFPDGSGGRNVNVFTFNLDGSDIIRTFSEPVWGHGGGHPNWHPDGKHLIRNLKPDGKRDKLCKVPIDGSQPTILSETIDGGGHPTMEPSENYIITDAMYNDPDPVVRIRLINVVKEEEQALCVMPSLLNYADRKIHRELRLDGHPAWDRKFERICFQATPGGHRQLFISDLSAIIKG
ncbi:TolB family protein [Bacteroidota bacterium]